MGAIVIKISKANSFWVFADPVGELHPSKVPQHIIYVCAETQIVECFIVEIDVSHKPLLKTREFLLLLLRQYDEAICGIPRSVWRWRG
jgi:hypothetical protein